MGFPLQLLTQHYAIQYSSLTAATAPLEARLDLMIQTLTLTIEIHLWLNSRMVTVRLVKKILYKINERKVFKKKGKLPLI